MKRERAISSPALLIALSATSLVLSLFLDGVLRLTSTAVFAIAIFQLGRILESARVVRQLSPSLQHISELRVALHQIREPRTQVIHAGLPSFEELTQAADRDLFRSLQQETLELLSRYELITTNIAASIIISDIDGKSSFCSPYTEVLTGHPLEEIYGCENDFLRSLVLDEDLERYMRARAVCSLGEDTVVRYQIRHATGLKLWLESRLVPIINDSGEVSAILSVSIDVTDSVNRQRQIEEQNRDLSDFSYMISHDLKAPIFTIRGMAAALAEDYGAKLEGDALELLEYIGQAADRLEKLVASVIQYSSVSAGDPQETDVSLEHLLPTVLQDLSEQIRIKKASVSIGPLPVVRGTQIRLYQVFSNLIGNALKYSAEGREPVISVEALPSSRDAIVICVTDNGSGIPEAKLEDIFRPYHRAHGPEIEGSGIGLACVKKIIERAGGQVWVKSVQGEGSSFFVQLPLPTLRPHQIPPELQKVYERV